MPDRRPAACLSPAALLVLLASTGGAGEPELGPLMRMLMDDAAAITGLPPAASLPRIELVDPAALNAFRDGAPAHRPGLATPELRALYLDGVIYLPRAWRPDNDADRAMLLHELVHHMQREADVVYRCRGESERPAYEAQRAWLEGRGHDAFEAMGMTPLFYALNTVCFDE